MSPQKSDLTPDENANDRLSNDALSVERSREITLDPISQTPQRRDEFHAVEDNKEDTLLQSQNHLDVDEEEKYKPSCIELLNTRLNSLFNSPIFLTSMASLTITMNSFAVKVLARDYSVFQVVTIRGVIGIVFLLCTLLWKGIFPLGPRNKIPPLIMRGMLGGTAVITSWIAISLLPLSEASFLWNSYPIVTAVLASLLGMEKLNWMTWLGVGGTAIGNALVAHPPFIFGGNQDWDTGRIVGLVVSTVSVLTMGSTFIVVKRIGKNVHPLVHSNYQLACSVLISVPFLSASYPEKIKIPNGVLEFGLFLIVSLGSIATQGLTVAALQRGSPTLVTAVLITNMIYSGIIGIFALSESFSFVSGSGAAIVLVSVLLVVFGRGRSNKQELKPLSQTEEDNELGLGLVLNGFNLSNEDSD